MTDSKSIISVLLVTICSGFFNLSSPLNSPNISVVPVEVTEEDNEETKETSYVLYTPSEEADELVVVSVGIGMKATDSSCYKMLVSGKLKPDCYILIVSSDIDANDTPGYVSDLKFKNVYYVGFSAGGFKYSEYRNQKYNGVKISKAVLVDGSPKSIKGLDEVYYIAYYNDDKKMKSVYKERYESVLGTDEESSTYLSDNNDSVYIYDFRDIYEENSGLHSRLDYWCFAKGYEDENFGQSLSIFDQILN